MKGLSKRQWDCLRAIEHIDDGSVSAREVAAQLDAPPEGVSRTIASLVRRGLVHKFDGRPPRYQRAGM